MREKCVSITSYLFEVLDSNLNGVHYIAKSQSVALYIYVYQHTHTHTHALLSSHIPPSTTWPASHASHTFFYFDTPNANVLLLTISTKCDACHLSGLQYWQMVPLFCHSKIYTFLSAVATDCVYFWVFWMKQAVGTQMWFISLHAP